MAKNKLVLLLAVVLSISLVGCGNSNNEEDLGAKDKSKAYNLYENALDQTNAENSFNSNIYVSNSYSYEDSDDENNDYDHETTMDFDVKENNVNDAKNLEFKIDGNMTVDGQSVDLTTYMKDDISYNDYLGYKYYQKYDSNNDQTSLAYQQAKVKKSQIKSGYYDESNGVTIITFELKLKAGLTYLADSLDEDQQKRVDSDNFKKLKMTVKIGKDGYIKEMKTEIEFEYEEKSITVKTDMTLKIDYKDFKKQNIKWPDFSTYQEANQENQE